MSDPSAPRQRPRPKTAGARVDTTRGAHPQAAAPLVCQKTMMLHNQQPEQQQRPEMSNAVDGNVFPQTRGRIRQNNHGELPPVEETEVHLGFRRGSQAHAAQPRAHSRVVEVTGVQLKTAQAYRHYFQTNINGGEVEKVHIDQETNTAFVTFVKSEDAEKAVKHKHMIGEQIVNLRLLDGIQSAPSDLYLDKLLFTNVDVTREKGYLSLYFKSVADCEPIEDQILYGDRAGDVLVTFKQQPDILKTKENCRKQHFETHEVAVRRVLKSKCVIVENLSPASTQDGVRNYFENPHRGGASVENITFSEDNKRCFVYFTSSEVAERIAQRDHRFDDSNLRVKVYMECLGPSAGGFDPRDFYFPQPMTVGDVVKDADPHVRTFLKETKKVQRDWLKKFAAEDASISFGASEEDPITVSCTLGKTHPQFRLLADRWKTVVKTLLKNMLGAVDMCKVKVMKDSWEDVENHIKGKFSVNGDTAMLIPIAAEEVIVVVGLIEKIGDIQKKLKKAVADIEKNNSKRTKKPVKLERHEISLLDKCNVFQELENKFRDFKITVNTAKGTVVFDGIRINTEEADRDVQVFLRKVGKEQIEKLKAIQKTLLGRDTTCQSINASLREKRLRAIWETDGEKVYLYAVGEGELTEAKKVIRKHLALETCQLSEESTELLKTDKFETTVKQKTAEQQGRLIIDYKVADRMITIAGSTARETKKQIEQYMFENTVYSETVSFSGSRQEIIKTEWGDKLNVIKIKLQAYLVDISFGENDRTIAVKGTSQGLKQVRSKLEELGKKILCQVENLTQPDKIKFLYSKKCETNRKRIILTSHCVISLEEESADLQVLKSTRPPTPQPDDEDIPADEKTDDKDEMQDDNSDEDTLVAGASKDADKDETLAKTNKHRKKPKELAETTEHKSPIEEPRPIQERIQVMKGDITNLRVQDGQVDVIVNAANNKLEHMGGLAQYIVEKGGEIIQTESRSIMSKRSPLKDGDVVATGPGQLPCKEIFHAVGPRYRDGRSGETERLALTVRNCLQLACDRLHQGIALPAISTGIFGYPVEEATLVAMEATKDFLKTRAADCSLQTVVFCDTVDEKVRHFHSAKAAIFPEAKPATGQTGGLEAAKGDNSPQQKAGTTSPVASLAAVPRTVQDKRNDTVQQQHAFPPAPAVQGTAAPVPLTTVLSLSLVKGEIAKQQADVIVSSVSKDLVLTSGAVSKSILNQAGPKLQNEIKENYLGKFKVGDVAITNGYGLRCRHVFHACLSSWSDESSAQLLHKVTTRCLSEASTRGYTSIAFPALGAGALSFPKDVVAQTMLQVVQQFEQTNPSTSLREVRLVTYPTDQAVYSAFDTVMNQTGGRPPPHMPQGGPHPPLPVAHMGQPHHRADGEFNVSPHDRQTPLSPDKSEIELDGFSEDREVEECMLLGICFVVKQGLKESESADAIVVYGDPKNPPNKPQDETDILVVNVATHKGKWDKGFSQCLKDAADRNHKRIALDSPVADKKQLLAKPFAEALFKAVTQVHEHLKNVQEIYVLFADHRDVNIFMMTMEKLGKAYNKSNPNAVKDKGAGDAWSQPKKPFEMSRRSATMPSTVTLYIYAAEQQHLKIFCEELENYVKETFSSEEMKQEQLTRMNEKFIQMIKKVARNKDVKLTINQKNGTIALYGFKDDVANAKDDIRQIFEKATKEEHEEEKMEIYANIAQWSYLLEETDKGSKRVDYSRDQNSVIEKAFQAKDTMVNIQHNDGRKCIIDFNNMVEYPETDRQVEVLVLRRDNVQDKQEDYSTPEDWDPHAKNELVKLVRLSPTSTEFTSVRDHFRATIHNTKVSIEEITRIQNKALYQQYRVKKRQMETQNQDVPNLQNERVVWHGTAKDATDNINNHGFNRSYCGKNATIHGMGVYFAANSEYSARDTYSPADDQGKRYMYQSKVLVGVSCPSDQNMRFLPPRSGNVFYDSACDNVNSPGIIVIFNDTQAYPEYLITFKKA